MKKYILIILGLVAVLGLPAVNTRPMRDLKFAAIADNDIVDMRTNVPLYKFDSTVEGEFLEKFCQTMSDINDIGQCLFIEPPDSTEHKWFDADLNEYVYVFANDMSKSRILNACGVLILPGRHAVLILSDNNSWLSRLPIHKTEEIVTLKYGTDFGSNDIFFIREGFYTAALHITDDGKIDPVSIRYNFTSIQGLKAESAFDWIEPFYKEHALPGGCGYYDQINLMRAVLRR